MNIEVHKIGEELVATRPDPFVWVDPFAEAEEWALTWAKAATGWAEEVAQVKARFGEERSSLIEVIDMRISADEKFRARLKGLAEVVLSLSVMSPPATEPAKEVVRYILALVSEDA